MLIKMKRWLVSLIGMICPEHERGLNRSFRVSFFCLTFFAVIPKKGIKKNEENKTLTKFAKASINQEQKKTNISLCIFVFRSSLFYSLK